MRAWIGLVIIAAVALYWGGQNTFIAVRDRNPREISCADYVKSRPDDRYLKLTSCEYDIERLAYREKGDAITDVFLPLRVPADSTSETMIVVKRTDDAMRAVARAIRYQRTTMPPETKEVMKQLQEPTIGLVEFGLDLDDKERQELAGLGLGLHREFVIIEYGAEPRLLLGALVLLLGVAAGSYALWSLFRRIRPKRA
jgi:hypothetical protein